MKKWCIVLWLSLCALNCFSQDEPSGKGFQKSRLFVGGTAGLAFGDYTYINLSPHLGYHFNRFLAAGMGINGEYQSTKDYDAISGALFSKTKMTIIGLNVFGRVYPIRYFMLQVQPEANYIFGKISFYDSNPKQTYNLDAEIVPSVLAGGGLVLPSPGGEFIAAVFYDVLQNPAALYGRRAIVRIGYNFNF